MKPDTDRHDTGDRHGPLDEEWRTADLVLGFMFGAVYVVMILTGLTAGEWRLAGIAVTGPLAVALGYESGIIPHFKWEVFRRV